MATLFRNSITHLLLGSVLVSTVALAALPTQAQSPGDIIVIGDSPSEWSHYQSLWNQLLNLRAPRNTSDAPEAFSEGEDPAKLAQELMDNLKVTKLRLEPILRLNGSSIALGTVANKNDEAVTIGSVNFEVFDAKGKLLETGSAIPEPSTLQPGQTVTFRRQLLNIPPDTNYKIKLSKTTPFTLLGGF